MQNLGFARNLHHRTGNDKVTELLLRLSIFCLFLAFEQEKNIAYRTLFQSVRYALLKFAIPLGVYFKPARGNDGKADPSADDAGGDQIVLKQFDFCAQKGADEQHQRKEAEKDEIFKTASHDKTPSLRLTRAFESAEPMRALSGRLCLQAVFHKKRINKFRLLCVKDLPKSVICHYTETK